MPRPLPPHPSRATSDTISVEAVVRLTADRHFIQVGNAAPVTDPTGRRLLCIRLQALPTDHCVYLPLQDVLALATRQPALDSVADISPVEPHGPLHLCRATPTEPARASCT